MLPFQGAKEKTVEGTGTTFFCLTKGGIINKRRKVVVFQSEE